MDSTLFGLFSNLFGSGSFIPHGHCYLWNSGLVWLHVASDAIIAIAYYSIPLTLLYFVRKREDLPFHQMFLLFSAFIIFCGTTHLAEIWTLWFPTYWLSGGLKAGTALISAFTALELVPLVPQALALPSPTQLAEANQALQVQIEERSRIEAELRQFQNELEHRVEERTTDLVQVNQQLQKEIHERHQAQAEREQLLLREQVAREQAESANRIKDEFLAVLSHELRSPLNPILGWSKLLQRGKLDAQASRRALEVIERNAKLQAQLIEDLLDVSRILQGKIVLNPDPVSLITVIEGAIETVRLAAESKSIDLQFTYVDAPEQGFSEQPSQSRDHAKAQLFQVHGDSARLQQVVWNLLSNAIKFTPNGGQVSICLKKTDTYAQIQIKDTGKGISPDFFPYVFDYFRQEDGAITRKFGGLGLGLAIVKHLTDLHGGSVAVDSLGEGQGTSFTVEFSLLPTATALVELKNVLGSRLK